MKIPLCLLPLLLLLLLLPLADTVFAMVYPSMRSARRALTALIVGIAAALFFTHSHTSPGRISLPPAHRPAAVPAGKARITKIVDGDTVHMLLAAEHPDAEPVEEKVRLFGINAPELHARPGTRKEDFTPAPCSQEASDFLARLCPVGSEVGLTTHGREKYGRLLAILFAPDGRDVNKALIEAGLAKAYFLGGKKGDTLRLDYEQAEDNAREARRGIWK